MSEPPVRFGAGATRLCAIAAHLLGWRPHEFWNATPEELATILQPASEAPSQGLDRATLNAMMERDNER
ncbi:phage tail assembly chaperone [Novosphingobium mangrovi (ex Hu et al. 2023)]|uniref:Phage tail assembly chaperone n=1 Tax=Novosphingobium mangrovi (ex Hu et al. 2023) TaxID=2930094 RepID=A0ABT0AD27_9SPHN|nr:phage tail assembly chaperone [Novosphingobium mangrovi (ex Hu et al. 2023)]MCJ1961103.1 phage tail assembly chaperone [Novosphingobium mangrovi (ex Hu et al. 2023)]